jgi:agmatinase
MPSSILSDESGFLGVDPSPVWDEIRYVVLPVALEMTTTFFRGTERGPESLLQASHQVELWDDELHQETVEAGIATLPVLTFKNEDMDTALRKIEVQSSWILKEGKRPVVVGGEHSVTIGVIRAFKNFFHDFSVLHLDAHADLRDQYNGSPNNHACVMARVGEMAPFVSVGIRSLSSEEAVKIDQKRYSVFDIHTIRNNTEWVEASLRALQDRVYITCDLDVFDPSVMPGVGTPEPGGLEWLGFLSFIKRVFQEKEVIGLDIMELCTPSGVNRSAFIAAKLLYRLIGYWDRFKNHDKKS